MGKRNWTIAMETITGYSLNKMAKLVMILNRMLKIQWMDMDARYLHKIYSSEDRWKISEIMPRQTFDLFKSPDEA